MAPQLCNEMTDGAGSRGEGQAPLRTRWSPVSSTCISPATVITSDMNVSRRVLAHMNPLAVDDVTNVETRFKVWVKQLQAVERLIP